MTAMLPLTPKVLQALRQRGGVVSGAELQELLGVSQPTVSRDWRRSSSPVRCKGRGRAVAALCAAAHRCGRGR
ncbi:HTH domain-containing protein [Polaromonas sp. P1(28)-13]|nr:HTH domain-containing protein [Polaromonas sp. P1(28)-13]